MLMKILLLSLVKKNKHNINLMRLKKIKINFKITNNNINLIIYDLSFGILYHQIYIKDNILLNNTFYIKELFLEYLWESGVLKKIKK